LRLFNTTDERIALTLEISAAFEKAWITDLAEQREADLTITDGKIKMEIPAKKIITVELE
jgi:hypothetical protein